MKLFVGGRICLFGEHSDWAGGYKEKNQDIIEGKALVVGIDNGIYANVAKGKKLNIRISCKAAGVTEKSLKIEMEKDVLYEKAMSNTFFSLCCGVAYIMLTKYKIGGLKIDIDKITLPIKKGLASSAAICVLIARAFNKVYGLNLTEEEEAEIAYEGEHLCGSKCGRLDQFCALGSKVYSVTFSEKISYQKVAVKEDIPLVIVDLGKSKDTRKILDSLNEAYPFPRNEIDEKLHYLLGEFNKQILAKAKYFMRIGDNEALGSLMTKAQQEFDKCAMPLCPDELTSPALHKLLNDDYIKSLTYGGKGMGSQGDGTAQFIAKDLETQRDLVEYLKKLKLNSYTVTIKKQNIISKAVIPVAGYGTRLYPFTKVFFKEFSPVLHNGLLKPQISVLLEELYDSGIRDICLSISSERQKEFYVEYFQNPTLYLSKVDDTKKIAEYDKKLKAIWDCLTFVYNNDVDKGFAYSISLFEKFVNNENFLLCLGDTVYSSNIQTSCTRQLLDFYASCQKQCVGLFPIESSEAKNFGTFKVLKEMSQNKLMAEKLYEKPSREFAEKHLLYQGKTLAFFGNYILSPQIFDIMKGQFAQKGNKTQFTECLDILREKDGFYGLLIDGHSYDFGNVDAYRSNFSKLAKGEIC